MDVRKSIKSFLEGEFMSTPIVVLIAFLVGLCALFLSKSPDSPIEQISEDVIEYELGLPAGSIDLSKDNKK